MFQGDSNKNKTQNILQKGIRAKERWEVGHIDFVRQIRAWVGGLPIALAVHKVSTKPPFDPILWLCRLFHKETPLERFINSWLNAPVLN